MKTLHIYDNIMLNSSQNEKFLRQNLWRNSKHTFYFEKLFSFSQIVPFVR